MVDHSALVPRLRTTVAALEEDIRARVTEVPGLPERLEREHRGAVSAGRIALSLADWTHGEVTQGAVAWVLGCVFVRFLEDNGLVDRPFISGVGDRRAAALGRREEYFRQHPDHSDREYLEDCFRTVALHPAVAPLFDRRHSPIWYLGPSADGAVGLRETFTAIDPDTGSVAHDFRDGDLGTRFLGDLYQDLSDTAKKRYALLQTPHFVEGFILDRTLEPAIEEFGLPEVRLVDPTCGSGHFLIGAFERLFGYWQAREPGTASVVLAQRALDAVHGVDLNPYAVAIARFRLVVAALARAGVRRLAEAPAFTLNLATGDSLLHGPLPGDGAPMLFDANRLGKNIAHVFETEDAGELRRILGQGYHAVVGNPPYISVADDALREAYRKRYATCHMQYVLTVPFMERFFELARLDDGARSGFVGQITGNSFMKREFGGPLVERFLPSQDVTTVVDTSGAYIPGHGTPTVILIGRPRKPTGTKLRVLDGIRGEPSVPEDPAKGLVWQSILDLIDQPGNENEFIRSSDIDRSELSKHPMTLGIGRELSRRLSRFESLRHMGADLGRCASTGEDNAFLVDSQRDLKRKGVVATRIAAGDGVRDWSISLHAGLWPYELNHGVSAWADLPPAALRFLWPLRTVLAARRKFGKPLTDAGIPWWGWQELYGDRLVSPLSVVWGFVGTHNHFALDRKRTVFRQSAPVFVLQPGAEEEDYLAYLGALNSSVVCFWLKQVCQTKGSSGMGRGVYDEAWEFFYEFPTARIGEIPVSLGAGAVLSGRLDRLAAERAELLDDLGSLPDDFALSEFLARQSQRDEELRGLLISAQEELDWAVLAAYGLVSKEVVTSSSDAVPPLRLGQRAFEIVLARAAAAGTAETAWFARHKATPICELPADWSPDYKALVERRMALIDESSDVGLIEEPAHKRRWLFTSWEERQREALATLILDELERPELWADLRPKSTAELADHLRRNARAIEAVVAVGDQDADVAATVTSLVLEAAVPHLAALRLTEKGLRKRAAWEAVWELQRQADAIARRASSSDADPQALSESAAAALIAEHVGEIPVPPRYAQVDFRAQSYWRLRGKLDVAKERFTLLVGAARGGDTSPVVGWAGWDERDLSRAIAGRITELRDQDGAEGDQLVPLLAGVLELLPWIYQWHPDSDSLYGGPPGRYFDDWLDAQLSDLGVTRQELRDWRPPSASRGRRVRSAL